MGNFPFERGYSFISLGECVINFNCYVFLRILYLRKGKCGQWHDCDQLQHHHLAWRIYSSDLQFKPLILDLFNIFFKAAYSCLIQLSLLHVEKTHWGRILPTDNRFSQPIKCSPNQITALNALWIILGPLKHVLHLVWSAFVKYTANRTALKVALYDFLDGPPAPLNSQLMEKVNHYNLTKKINFSMGPSVKFVLAIIDSISKKKWV